MTAKYPRDKQFVLHGISQIPSGLKCAPEAFLNDSDVVICALEHGDHRRHGEFLRMASDRLRGDRAFLQKALDTSVYAFEGASDELRDDDQLVLQVVKKHGDLFAFASERLRTDKNFIRQAMMGGEYYCFFSIPIDFLRENEDFLVELLSNPKYLSELLHLPDKFRADREIVLQSMQQNPYTFMLASTDLRSSRDVVMQAVSISGLAYEHASDELKAERDIVLAAVRQNHYALQHAPRNFWSDPDIIREAVEHEDFRMIDAFVDEKPIALHLARVGRRVLHLASPRLRADQDVVSEAVQVCWLELSFAHPDLAARRDIVLKAVRHDGRALQFASDDLKSDLEVVSIAVLNNAHAYHHASADLKLHPEVVGAAIRSIELHYLMFWLPKEVKVQLKSAISGIQQQHDWQTRRAPVSFLDGPDEEEGSAVRHYVENEWKPALRHKIWLLKKRMGGGAPELVRSIIEYDMQNEFRVAQEVLRLAPIFSAFAHRGYNWTGIQFPFLQ